ncbi:rRNA-processing protein UTP11 [Aspergillus lucknowensis]|uniref:U3 small nucleolar RNA-associated protein 11 n=1 Tax=Aspergillus lucknowensis TaxID=176173 RepID=A0ABR4LGQ5_9EURO
MSSMRNAVQRRQHRERGQLKGREKWGLLEKHKDYSLRAKDYNTKKAKIKRLEEKARERNPDEFAFGMMSSHSAKKGKHGAGMRDSATAQGLSHDAIKLLKTQDAGYLRTVGERVRRAMEKVREEVKIQEGISELLGDGEEGKEGKKGGFADEDDDDEFGFDFGEVEKKPRKLVFADDREEQRGLKRALESADDEDEDEEGEEDSFGALQREQPKKTWKQLEAEKQALLDARRARKMKKTASETRLNKLKALQKQYADITAAERALDLQRAKMSNSIGGVNKNGLKFKIRERKR